jgi:hypothetical protein
MAGLADVGSPSEIECGNQTELVLGVDLALAGGNLERREVTGSLGEGPAIFGGADTGVRGSSVLPDCILFGIVCGSSSVRRSGQLTGTAAASSCEYRSEGLGVGVVRCQTQSENRTQYCTEGFEWGGHSKPLNQPGSERKQSAIAGTLYIRSIKSNLIRRKWQLICRPKRGRRRQSPVATSVVLEPVSCARSEPR